MKNQKYLRKNQQINIERRKQLIQFVINKKISIKDAGNKLGFKRSTAIMIIKKFRSKGYLTSFKKDLKNYSQILQNQQNQCPKLQSIPELPQQSSLKFENPQTQNFQLWPLMYFGLVNLWQWPRNGVYFMNSFY